MKGPYLIPFCTQFKDKWLQSLEDVSNSTIITTAAYEPSGAPEYKTVWETLDASCQFAANVVIAFAGVLLICCAIFNMLTIFVAIHKRVERSLTKEDEESAKRMKTYKKSIWAQTMFLCSFAMASLVAACFLLPTLMVTAYEMMSFNETPASSYRLSTAKHVSNAVFHFIVSLSLYSILGAICERWIALIRIKPQNYLCKVSNPIIELKTKMNMNRKPVKDEKYSISCLSRLPLLLYLLVSWAASFMLAVISVIYGQERFLLYGDRLQNRVDQFHPLSSFFIIPANRIQAMTIIYVVMLFAPAVFLVFCIVATSITLLKTRSNAMRLNSYEQAQALVYFQSRQESKRSSDIKTDRLARNSSLKVSSGGVKTVASRDNVSYSHKQEHTQQVMTNCQEADLSAVITDSIQMQQDAAANRTIDARLPLPPDWLKFPSIKRSDTMASAVRVDDLATTPLSVPYDSAVSFFGEITEAKATLCTYSVVYLIMLPLYSLIAVDVFADPTGIFNLEMPFTTYQWYNASGAPSLDNLHVISFTTTDFAVIVLFLYMFAGTLPFSLMASLSPSFQRAAKENLKCPSRGKKKPKPTSEKISLDAVERTPSRRNREPRSRQEKSGDMSRRRRTPRKSWMGNHAEYWQAFSRRSQAPSDHAWHPTKRPRSSYIDNTVNIDERFEEEV